LEPLKIDYPSLTEDEGSHPMTECATFADNIKATGYSWQAGWHFIDQPDYDQGNNNYPFVPDTYDVVGAMQNITDWLSGTGDYQSGYYYQKITSSFPNQDDARSFALRLLIHYVGDIHQPLHAATLVNDDYPYGDSGGNLIHLPNICGASNLHAVWDSLEYLYCGYPNLPLNNTDWNWYTTTEELWASQYPIDHSKLYPAQFQQWADESLQIAETQVYPGVVANEPLSQAYLNQAEDTSKTQVMYAGYRLNLLLQQIYGSAGKEVSQ